LKAGFIFFAGGLQGLFAERTIPGSAVFFPLKKKTAVFFFSPAVSPEDLFSCVLRQLQEAVRREDLKKKKQFG
jgi:hypothetical protein